MAARASSINDELWRIFSFYSLECGDKNDPEHLDSSQFLRFCQCCEICDGPDDTSMSIADINLLFTTQIKAEDKIAAAGGGGAAKTKTNPSGTSSIIGAGAKREGSGRGRQQNLSFDGFLHTLVVLAMRNAQSAEHLEPALLDLLERKVLPNAERRLPSIVSIQMAGEDTIQLKEHFQTPMQTIFTHYADAYDRRMRGIGRPASHKRMMGYYELLQFATDCHLTMLPRLSRLEIGNIFLAVAPVPTNSAGKRVTSLRFPQFWEALVRFAMLAFGEMRQDDVGEQICGLFLVIWRTLSEANDRGAKGPPGRADYLQQVYKLFLERFMAFWAHDNYREYLREDAAAAVAAPDLLSKLRGEERTVADTRVAQSVGQRVKAHAQNIRDAHAGDFY